MNITMTAPAVMELARKTQCFSFVPIERLGAAERRVVLAAVRHGLELEMAMAGDAWERRVPEEALERVTQWETRR